jgi:hypothetical protein
MKKRITAAILWFYAGWFAGAVLAFALGWSPALAPILEANGLIRNRPSVRPNQYPLIV